VRWHHLALSFAASLAPQHPMLPELAAALESARGAQHDAVRSTDRPTDRPRRAAPCRDFASTLRWCPT
jgi:hypothetical protein